MGRLINHWATAHRNTRAAFSLVGIVLIFGWALYMKHKISLNPVMETGQEVGEVKTVKEFKAGRNTKLSSEISIYRGIVELPDGTQIQLGLVVPPKPKPGDQMPLIYERYKDGTVMYRVDPMEWKMNGPG